MDSRNKFASWWILQNVRLCSPCVQQILAKRCGIHSSLLLEFSQALQDTVSRFRCKKKLLWFLWAVSHGIETTAGKSIEDGMVWMNWMTVSTLLISLPFFATTEGSWRCLASQRCLRRLRILICRAPNVFSSGDVTTADSPETMTVLPLGLTSALSLVCCQSPEAAGPETPHDVVSWMGVWWRRID